MSEERLERIEQKIDALASGIIQFELRVADRFVVVETNLSALGQKMDAGFQRLDAEMNAGFQRLDRRVDGVDRRLDRVDNRLDRVDQRLDRVERRLESIENTQTHINMELSEKIDDHEKRLSTTKRAREPNS